MITEGDWTKTEPLPITLRETNRSAKNPWLRIGVRVYFLQHTGGGTYIEFPYPLKGSTSYYSNGDMGLSPKVTQRFLSVPIDPGKAQTYV